MLRACVLCCRYALYVIGKRLSHIKGKYHLYLIALYAIFFFESYALNIYVTGRYMVWVCVTGINENARSI